MNDSGGQSHPSTVRKVSCDILCHPSRYTLRCKSCQFLQCTLTSSVIQVTSVDERTSSTSHTSNRNLSSAEKDTYMAEESEQQVIGQLLENEGVSLQDDDATDIFTECSRSIDKRYLTESPQRIFGKSSSTLETRDR